MEKLLAAVSAGVTACGSGYGVVDPMPTPVICPSRNVTASAAFEKQPDGELLIAVRLDAPTRTDTTYADEQPVVQNASVVSKGRIGSAMELRLRVDPNFTGAELTFGAPISCPSGKDALYVTISWTTRAEGAPVSVAVTDHI